MSGGIPGSDDTPISFQEAVKDIDRVPVDEANVKTFTRSSQYLELAFNLIRETAQWVTLFAGLGGGMWNVRDAILGGHLVRLSKLLRSLLDNMDEDREEIAWVILRLNAECVINFRFLLLNAAEDTVFSSYLHFALQDDVRLLKRIAANVEARGGEVWPIEERMRRSIDRAFKESGVSPDQVPENRIRNWGDKNLYEKAVAVGLSEHAYSAIFGGASRSVHGGWLDLLRLHLTYDESSGLFEPQPAFTRMRQPQPLFAIAFMTIPALTDYIAYIGFQETAALLPQLTDLNDRIVSADRLHEEFMQKRRIE
jgi:hypothetical protein